MRPPSSIAAAAEAPTESQCSSSKESSLKSKRRNRHGTRKHYKTKVFVKWLLDTFPSLVPEKHILEVAGGKGELSARLCMCHRQTVVMVDPRVANVVQCFENLVLPKIPILWKDRLHQQIKQNPNFLNEIFQKRFRQLVTTFDEHTLETQTDLQQAVQDASLIVGMHADGATEAIVDAALEYNKPFVVVPCCVFPRLFPQREIRENGRAVPVRNHEQFCQYLLEKDARLQRSVLPFEGRNIAIWWNGEDRGRSSSLE